MLTKIKSFFQNHYFLAFILGSVSALAFAPLYFFPLAILSFSGLFLIINQNKNNKESFWIGWWFGFGQFVFGVYWISISLFVDIAKFFWLLPFALFLIPAAIAVYIGLTVLLTNLISRKFSIFGWRKILLLAVIWIFFEYLRALLFSGFPWNLLGYTFLFSLGLSQVASFVGIYGLSLIAVIFYSAPALFLEFKNNKIKIHLEKDSKLFLGYVAAIVGSIWLLGSYKIKNFKEDFYPNATFRLVQPNIKQDEKWNQETRYNSFLENIKLSKSAGFENINYTVWSESAVPYLVSPLSIGLLADVASAVPANGYVITGGLRAEFKEDSREVNKLWNTIFAISSNGRIEDSYDKNHLVPFGEYVPFSEYLPFVSKITDGAINFSEGEGLKTIKLNSQTPSFSPLVCYEGIFPGAVFDKNNPPQFLLNLTNDAWFGASSGPYQHFDMVRMRSIENGIPTIRVANSGISGLIDPLGKIVAAIPLNEKGIVDVMLMKNLPTTPYMKYGNKIVFWISALLLAISLSGKAFRSKNKARKNS